MCVCGCASDIHKAHGVKIHVIHVDCATISSIFLANLNFFTRTLAQIETTAAAKYLFFCSFSIRQRTASRTIYRTGAESFLRWRQPTAFPWTISWHKKCATNFRCVASAPYSDGENGRCATSPLLSRTRTRHQKYRRKNGVSRRRNPFYIIIRCNNIYMGKYNAKKTSFLIVITLRTIRRRAHNRSQRSDRIAFTRIVFDILLLFFLKKTNIFLGYANTRAHEWRLLHSHKT